LRRPFHRLFDRRTFHLLRPRAVVTRRLHLVGGRERRGRGEGEVRERARGRPPTLDARLRAVCGYAFGVRWLRARTQQRLRALSALALDAF
jgi:hypothetical protein